MTHTLRDGSTTQDPRLDRIHWFDERSRAFPIRALVGDKKPRSYTWRCRVWYDQGREGACVGYSLAHELAARPAELSVSESLPLAIYHEAQRIDPWPGGSYPGASPRYEGTSVLAGVKVIHDLGYCGAYRWAFGLQDLILGVGYNGPAVIGVNWYEGMFEPDAQGSVRPEGRIAGGHAILVRAVNVREERFTLRNSWGSRWGKDGDCLVTFADMDRLLREDGEAVFLQKRKGRIAA